MLENYFFQRTESDVIIVLYYRAKTKCSVIVVRETTNFQIKILDSSLELYHINVQ